MQFIMPQIYCAFVCTLPDGVQCHRNGVCKCALPLPSLEDVKKGVTKGRFYICEFLELKNLDEKFR